MKKRRALAVRPYPDPLRTRVFDLLAGLGFEVLAPPEVGEGSTNQEAVSYVGSNRPDLLLVPFHVVRDGAGHRTSGLELIQELRRARLEFCDVPVVMPVSVYAQLAFEAAWRDRKLDRVFTLIEQDVDREETASALREFLQPAGARLH
jgi:CheY-like chemotaxis protein